MTDYIKVETKSFQDMCEQIIALTEENQSLKIDNDFLRKQTAACKMRCSKYCLENQKLRDEIADMKFTQKMLNSEEAGRAFARELLGKPMTEADLAEETFIANGEKHYYAQPIGDDF